MGTDSESRLEEATRLKTAGNAAFQSSDWSTAIRLYSEAITKLNDDSETTAIFLKNRAAAYLKTSQFSEALNDCDRSLHLSPMDAKALFRRCQALEGSERFEEAYRDALTLLKIDPQNRSVQSTLERLFTITQDRAKHNSQTSTKVNSMLTLCFDSTIDEEKRSQAFSNLIVLAREHTGSSLLLDTGVISRIRNLLKKERNTSIRISCIRIISALCKKDVQSAQRVLETIDIDWFAAILDANNADEVSAAQHCVQTLLNTLSGMKNRADSKPVKELCDMNKVHIDALLTNLSNSINSRLISGLARDAILELLMRNCHHDKMAWAERLVDVGGVERLLEVASELEELRHESAMLATPSTRTVATACVSRIYDNMYYDAARDGFMTRVDGFLRGHLLAADDESKIRAVVAMTALLRGAIDVGNAVMAKDGIIEMVLVMANSPAAPLQQRVAVECIIAATSKKDKARTIIAQGVEILKRLYASSGIEEAVRVRALVGLCKLGSSGGSDASIRPFAEGSNRKLANACRRFLLSTTADTDIRKWAAEGMSYLTLDAEVKEQLVEDKPALRAIIALARSGDQSVLYGVVNTLVNLCNAYDKQEMAPEMVELAKFAKHHIPEEHTLDEADFVMKRLHALAEVGVISALVALSGTESPNSKELIARVFNALCSVPELRGIVVAQGGAKVLLPLSQTATPFGRRQAGQALARIGITMDPAVALPGQRVLEVVRPLIALLAHDCTALENFEALMALCNIAQMGESGRQRILKEGGLGKIDHYLYEDHLMLCRAATQVICNMTLSGDVVKVYEGQNDRMKFLVALVLDEDEETSMAAAGAAAILTGSSAICCERFMAAASWSEAAKLMLSHAATPLQHRGVVVLKNILEASRELAEQIIATDLMEVIMAVTKLEAAEKKDVVQLAEECLKVAEGYGIICKPDNVPASQDV